MKSITTSIIFIFLSFIFNSVYGLPLKQINLNPLDFNKNICIEKINFQKTMINKDTVEEKIIGIINGVKKSDGKNITPAFSWTENGVKKSIKDFKGKVLLLNFWSTWCGPCKREMPDLSELNDELKDKDFQMIGLCVFDQNEVQNIKTVLNKIPVSYPIIQGNDSLVKAFEATTEETMEAVPTTYIINKKGKIVETIIGTRDKKQYLEIVNKYLE